MKKGKDMHDQYIIANVKTRNIYEKRPINMNKSMVINKYFYRLHEKISAI